MQHRIDRRVGTKVRNGKVQRKNNHIPTTLQEYVIDRRPPGRGFTHVLSKRHLTDFIELIPDWDILSHRLKRIELAPGSFDAYGWHRYYRREDSCSIRLCAWPKELWVKMSHSYFNYHRRYYEAFGVVTDLRRISDVECRFTIAQARAFTLLHVFMHELGHHHDWLHRDSSKQQGIEEYADQFADDRFDIMYPNYIDRFGDPARSSAEE